MTEAEKTDLTPEAVQLKIKSGANLTPAEVAIDLRISVRTVQRYIKAGNLEGLQVGKKYIIPAEALQRFKTQHTVKATEPTA